MATERARALSASMRDRLMLNPQRIAATARARDEIAELADPVGAVIAQWTQPNGLKFERVRTPLVVIGVIFESQTNVTAEHSEEARVGKECVSTCRSRWS